MENKIKYTVCFYVFDFHLCGEIKDIINNLMDPLSEKWNDIIIICLKNLINLKLIDVLKNQIKTKLNETENYKFLDINTTAVNKNTFVIFLKQNIHKDIQNVFYKNVSIYTKRECGKIPKIILKGHFEDFLKQKEERNGKDKEKEKDKETNNGIRIDTEIDTINDSKKIDQIEDTGKIGKVEKVGKTNTIEKNKYKTYLKGRLLCHKINDNIYHNYINKYFKIDKKKKHVSSFSYSENESLYVNNDYTISSSSSSSNYTNSCYTNNSYIDSSYSSNSYTNNSYINNSYTNCNNNNRNNFCGGKGESEKKKKKKKKINSFCFNNENRTFKQKEQLKDTSNDCFFCETKETNLIKKRKFKQNLKKKKKKKKKKKN